eukprot:gene9496-4764_t
MEEGAPEPEFELELRERTPFAAPLAAPRDAPEGRGSAREIELGSPSRLS